MSEDELAQSISAVTQIVYGMSFPSDIEPGSLEAPDVDWSRPLICTWRTVVLNVIAAEADGRPWEATPRGSDMWAFASVPPPENPDPATDAVVAALVQLVTLGKVEMSVAPMGQCMFRLPRVDRRATPESEAT